MMFVPLILSQGENLSLLNTKSIEKNITQQGTNPISRWTSIRFSYHTEKADITSKINFNLFQIFKYHTKYGEQPG
jgi:hypothetical protein